MGFRLQQVQTPNSKIAPEALERRQKWSINVQKNAMQAHIKYKAHYDKKVNASKLKEKD